MGDRRRTGQEGEQIAAQYLVREGYKILEKNYRRPWGEIDIIAEKAGTIRFVEVKAVSRPSMPEFSREMEYRPEELVHASKLRKVARTAALYMEERQDNREFQIDVVGVVMVEAARKARCRLFEQVLDDL